MRSAPVPNAHDDVNHRLGGVQTLLSGPLVPLGKYLVQLDRGRVCKSARHDGLLVAHNNMQSLHEFVNDAIGRCKVGEKGDSIGRRHVCGQTRQ